MAAPLSSTRPNSAFSPDQGTLTVRAETRAPHFQLGVDFVAPGGQTTVLLGPNGAGKSTTVALIAGLLTPERAFVASPTQVLIDTAAGIDLAPEQRRMGVVFADGLLFAHLTVFGNIAFAVREAARRDQPRVGRRRQLERASRLLADFELDHLASRYPSTLSSGQAQRVALVRALATEPDALLLDEPLARIDVAARNALRRTLSHLLERTAAPRLMITHDATEAFLLADQMLVIEGGQITQRGTPEEIRRHPRTPYAAELAGINLFRGWASDGHVRLVEHAVELTTSNRATSGTVLVTVHSSAVTLHATRPSGSPRNVWDGTVAAVEPLGDVTRVVLGNPLPLIVDITPGAARDLELAPGSHTWVAVKATEVSLHTDDGQPASAN